MVFLDSQSKAFKNQLKVFMKLIGKSSLNLSWLSPGRNSPKRKPGSSPFVHNSMISVFVFLYPVCTLTRLINNILPEFLCI